MFNFLKWGDKQMATMMASLMNDFYDLREGNEGNLSYGMAIDQAVSYANSCHQLTSCDTLNRVEGLLKDALDIAYDEGEISAFEDALVIVNIHREQLLNKG